MENHREPMSNLFKKAAVFTDIHFGKKSDSQAHNKDCLEFIDWFCSKAKEENADKVIFMGDWHDNRSRLRSDTLWYSTQALSKLISLGLPIFFIIGNHDIFFKNSRDIHSFPFFKHLQENNNIILVDEILETGNVMLCPWLIGDEFVIPPDSDAKYIFGHFEFPLFLANEMYEMPDRGGIHINHFHKNHNWIFSGHFHKRQTKINEHGVPITYIGNAFPHDFNDVGDTDRGMMILEWDKEPVYYNWPNAPKYVRTKISTLLEQIEEHGIPQNFDENTVVECWDDVGLSNTDGLEISEAMQEQIRDFRLRFPRKLNESITDRDMEDEGKSADQMINEILQHLDTEGSKYNTDLLIELYKGASPKN